MSIIRQRLVFEDHFTIMPNDWARDSRLTLRARGLLVQLLSHQDGWEITIESLVRNNPEGRDAIRKAIAELEKHGYLKRHRRVDPDTKKFGKMDYILTNPSVGKSGAGIPAAGEQPTKKTTSRTPCEKNKQASSSTISPAPADNPADDDETGGASSTTTVDQYPDVCLPDDEINEEHDEPGPQGAAEEDGMNRNKKPRLTVVPPLDGEGGVSPRLAGMLTYHGIPAEDHAAVLRCALADPVTDDPVRVLQSAAGGEYAHQCWAATRQAS